MSFSVRLMGSIAYYLQLRCYLAASLLSLPTGEVCASELRWRCAHLLSPYPAAFLSGLAVDEMVQYSPMPTHCTFASTPTLLQLRRCSQTWANGTSHSSIGMSLHVVVKPCCAAHLHWPKSLLMPSAQLLSESTYSNHTRHCKKKHMI